MSQSGSATGDIYPMRFVKRGTADGTVTQCGAGDIPIGISFKETRRSQYVDSTGKAAIAGEPISYYTLGERCYLELTGTVTPGARIKSDTNGTGVATTSNLDTYGAIAEDNGTTGFVVPVLVNFGDISKA